MLAETERQLFLPAETLPRSETSTSQTRHSPTETVVGLRVTRDQSGASSREPGY